MAGISSLRASVAPSSHGSISEIEDRMMAVQSSSQRLIAAYADARRRGARCLRIKVEMSGSHARIFPARHHMEMGRTIWRSTACHCTFFPSAMGDVLLGAYRDWSMKNLTSNRWYDGDIMVRSVSFHGNRLLRRVGRSLFQSGDRPNSSQVAPMSKSCRCDGTRRRNQEPA